MIQEGMVRQIFCFFLAIPSVLNAQEISIKCDLEFQRIQSSGNIQNSSITRYYIINDSAQKLYIYSPSSGDRSNPCGSEYCTWSYGKERISYSQTMNLQITRSQTDFLLNRVTGRLTHTNVSDMGNGTTSFKAEGMCEPSPLPPLAVPKF